VLKSQLRNFSTLCAIISYENSAAIAAAAVSAADHIVPITKVTSEPIINNISFQKFFECCNSAEPKAR